MPKNSSLQLYARLGAAARLSEIQEEMNEIRKAFPDLGEAGPRKRKRRRTAQQRPVRKRRGKLSAAARKAISDAQKKRWAAQKAKKS